LTAVYRSEAGGAKKAGNGAWIDKANFNDTEIPYRNNSHWIIPAGSVDMDDSLQYKKHITTGRFFYSSDSNNEEHRHLHDCLVDVPGPSNYVGYYDAASLYPSSGTIYFLIDYFNYITSKCNNTFIFIELSDIPIGTGTLYVLSSTNEADRRNENKKKPRMDNLDELDAFIPFKKRKTCTDTPKYLVAEHRKINASEREESYVVQYLALGGLKYFSSLLKSTSFDKPMYIGSGVHSGGGQQTFGYSPGQKADLMLVIKCKTTGKSMICFHNYHGHMWHYIGHFEKCPLQASKKDIVIEKEISMRMDEFKSELSKAWSLVRPNNVIFDYSVSYACQMFHGCHVSSIFDESKYFFNVKECLRTEHTHESWFPPAERFFEHENLKKLIYDGKITGFVCIKGGKESSEMKYLDPAGTRFGFCVQAYAASIDEISLFTKNQIAKFQNWGDSYFESEKCKQLVDKYIQDQALKTINSGTFHNTETISTTYLRWLMKERRFEDFEISHLLVYEFRNWSKDFLEPVLQRRHECKLRGDNVAAECLKLIGNGSYGYNGLESTNYDTVYLLTEKQLGKKMAPGKSLAHKKLKSVVQLGVIQVPDNRYIRRSKDKKTKKRDLLLDEISSNEDSENEQTDDEDEYDDNDDNVANDSNDDACNDEKDINNENSIADDKNDDKLNCNIPVINFKHYKLWRNNMRASLLSQRSMNAPLKNPDQISKTPVFLSNNLSLLSDHTYALPFTKEKKIQNTQNSFSYHFLYMVSISGSEKTIFNNLPKAVGVLSNSKRLFLNHISVMLKCLDPCLAELTYVDTDSCVWSLSKKKLEDCILKTKRDEWISANIIADEKGTLSCHGKLKLEGMFAAGQFRTIKIYRLYKENEELEGKKMIPAYTRCKGVNRYIATRLPNESFDSIHPQSLIVHRSALRPTQTGEIHMIHEARSVTCPFNLKRYVCNDGYHTLPFSLCKKQ